MLAQILEIILHLLAPPGPPQVGSLRPGELRVVARVDGGDRPGLADLVIDVDVLLPLPGLAAPQLRPVLRVELSLAPGLTLLTPGLPDGSPGLGPDDQGGLEAGGVPLGPELLLLRLLDEAVQQVGPGVAVAAAGLAAAGRHAGLLSQSLRLSAAPGDVGQQVGPYQTVSLLVVAAGECVRLTPGGIPGAPGAETLVRETHLAASAPVEVFFVQHGEAGLLPGAAVQVEVEVGEVLEGSASPETAWIIVLFYLWLPGHGNHRLPADSLELG